MNDTDFDTVYEILSTSFEPFLYRGYKRQKELLKNEKYNIITYRENKKIVGFLSYWNIDKDIVFIEHFAVSYKKRGSGIGKQLLENIFKLDGTKVLEVEPPHTETDKKRITFYQNFGFVLHGYDYYQPPYNKGDSKTKLHIMSSSKFSYEQFKNTINKIYSVVYNTKL